MRLEVICEESGKIGYATFSIAMRKMKGLSRLRKYTFEKDTFLTVYRCPLCKRFHYGNTSVNLKKLRKRRLDDEDSDSFF